LKQPAEITPLLERARSGDHEAMDEVAQRVHTDLSRLTRKLTAREERRGRDKRGSRAIRVSLSALGVAEAIPPSMTVPDLEAASASLEAADSRAARVARLRVLWGLDNDEIGDVLAIARSTVDGDWRFASAWIKARL